MAHNLRQLAPRFGTRVSNDLEQSLLAILDRGQPLNALAALEYSLNTSAALNSDLLLADTAICFDTNILLKLASHSKSAEVMDYLSTRHNAPLIIPGQVIQEFWNNHVGSLKTVAEEVEKKLNDLQKTIEQLDPDSPLAAAIFEIRTRTLDEYNFLYDAGLVSKTKSMFASLSTRAMVPFARRSLFAKTAELRKITKTPPGFRDHGHGDFYVWVDLLTGLQQARLSESNFVRVALITNDEKPDWVRNGMAHPILSSEVTSLFDVPLEIWKLDRLIDEVAKATS